MGDQYQHSWMRILPWILLSRRTSLHSELKTTPAQVVFGEDLRLLGDITPPMGAGETLEDLTNRVKANAERPPAQTALHRTLPVYFPPAARDATHVYTKRAKLTPLGAKYDGPHPILKRIGKSCLLLQVGHYNNGKARTEVRHWRTCSPAPPGDVPEPAARPKLGRPAHSGVRTRAQARLEN